MKTRFKKSEIASNGVKRLRIFVASPKDCSIERNTIRQLVTTNPTIRTIARELNVIPEIYGWEDVCPNGGRPQQVINAAIEKFNPDWFVFLFWHRLGSDAGEGITGTEEEWRLAQQYNQARGKDVSIYFNQASPPSYEIDGYQLEAVKRFREDIFCNFQALAKDFDGPKDFEEQVSAHLSEKLISRSTGIAQQITDIPSRLLDISAGLLKWPTTLGNGKQLDRPQLQTILRRFEELESSATIILGPPGSGKSAFLATLAKALQTCGTFLIAIKADQLGSNVDTLEDLRHWLDLPIGLREAILTLSNRNPVVLLVDQLDAVSELLDRKSGRLNLLLDLIHSLAGHRNVHIVASSREFEFRHDIRLSNIDAERVDLDAPTWEQIAKLLSEVGIREETIGEPLKRLLLLPLNLKIFLDIGASNATFESHHALLEELWKQRVVSADGVEGSELLLQLLVDRMSTEETLWLPSAVADGYRAARQALEQADVLTKGQNGLIIGFRHQTYYDFTLARAFARGSRSLSNDVLERQDGLFVRPSLISGLNYLRAAARREYHKQLSILMTSQLRLHLRTLIIEVLGEQNDPDGVEAEIMLPLLASEHEGPRVLRSVANSIGWFARLKKQKEFLMWLRMPPDKAAHCVPLLSSAIHYDPETCVNLIAHFWKGNELFDSLTLAVLQQKKDWDRHGVELVCTIARRTQLQWAIENIAESVADSVPALAPMIIRADYDRRLEKALKDLEEPVPELSADADRQQRLIHEMAYEKSRPVRQILEDKQGWENLEEFGVRAPKAFLDQLWPWFLNAVTQMAEDEHAFVIGYRHDPLSYRSFEGDLEPAPLVGLF